MPIAELGYRTWEGRRTGAVRRALAIARTEVAVALQSSKLLRRFLILAWLPILYFCPVFLSIGYVSDPRNDLAQGAMLSEIARELLTSAAIEKLREDPQALLPGVWAIAFHFFFAYTQSLLAMITVAIAGPPLIAKDLRTKAFLVYFSKPIQPWQYVLGKIGTVVFFVFSMTLFPALVLYAVGIALSPDLGTAVATAPIVLRVVGAALMVALPTAVVVLVLSALTADRRIATFAWLAVWIFGEIAFRALTLGGGEDFVPPRWAGLLSLRELTTRLTAGVFDLRANVETLQRELGGSGGWVVHMVRDVAGDPPGGSYPPIVFAAVLATISVAGVWFLLRRVVRPVQV